jgi:hypothetical protein
VSGTSTPKEDFEKFLILSMLVIFEEAVVLDLVNLVLLVGGSSMCLLLKKSLVKFSLTYVL